MDTSEAYRSVRERVIELASAADPATPVPTCPEWTVRDLLAHLSGVAADVVSGNLGGVGTQPWVDAQLAARTTLGVDDLVAEWSVNGPQVDEICLALGDAVAQLVFDTVCHEQDLRHALGQPGGRDGALDIALGWVGAAWASEPAEEGALRLRAGTLDVTRGAGPPTATVTLPPFEALRALTGRRSPEQIRGYGWVGDPEPWAYAFTWGPFTPAPESVVEA